MLNSFAWARPLSNLWFFDPFLKRSFFSSAVFKGTLFKATLLSGAVASVLLSTGCASNQSLQQPAQGKALTNNNKGYGNSGLLDANSLDSLQDLLSATDMRAVEGDRLLILKHGDVWKRMTVGFKMDLEHYDPRIEAQRAWFISRQPYLDRLSARASRYLYHTVKEAERRGMPTELALLPVIESSYDPAATSSAAAAGLWQFIPSTGRIYGLKQNELYDGRRDVVESTRAAYEFLGSLYNQFGSWELALASYNAGPGTVQKAINRNIAAGLPTDYWSLRLPQETMNYVPRFLAVAQIIKKPKDYGVNLPPIANRPHFREVLVSGGVDLNQIANVTGLPRAELYALNPAHRGERLAPEAQLRLLIPADLNPSVDQQLNRLKPEFPVLLAANTSTITTTSPIGSLTSTSAKASITTSSTTAIASTTSTKQSKASTTSTKQSNFGASNRVNSQVLQPSPNTPPALGNTVNNANTAALSNVSAATKGLAASTATLRATPRGSAALAAFAASADMPSAPRIPVAVTPAKNIQPVNVQPSVSAADQQQIAAQFKAEGLAQSIQPQATQLEKDRVVAEIKAIAPTDTEIVDPLDGKIKLTALQTSLSVAEKKGQELSKSFAYPKALAEAETRLNSDAAQRNQGKNLVRTATDVVVVPPKGKRNSYRVMAGDTLASIALKNGVSWTDIAKWNQIDPNKTLYVGSTLYLYDAKPINSPSNKDKIPDIYVVKAGDNLSNIANQFDVAINDLAEWNALSSNGKVMVGQKLYLNPSSAQAMQKTTSKATTKTSTKTSNHTQSYSVKHGENLQVLAQRYGVSNSEFAAYTEGLTANSRLQAGQKINVPVGSKNSKLTTAKVSTQNYRVKRGETLSSIADKFKMDVTELRELNDLRSSSIIVGQSLNIPVDRFVPDDYVVKSGDHLTAIATRFGLDVSALARKNDLKLSSNLQVGQRLDLAVAAASATDLASGKKDTKDKPKNDLKDSQSDNARDAAESRNIKVKSSKTESYTVKSGESWGAIAPRFELSAKALAELNGMTTRNSLQRGQNIEVPKMVAEYTIKRGDTLIALANKYGIDESDLAKLNGLKSNSMLRVGDTIKVPN